MFPLDSSRESLGTRQQISGLEVGSGYPVLDRRKHESPGNGVVADQKLATIRPFFDSPLSHSGPNFLKIVISKNPGAISEGILRKPNGLRM